MKQNFKTVTLLIVVFIAIGTTFCANAQQTAPKKKKPVRSATATPRELQMTSQQYCDKLSGINDTLAVYYKALVKRLETAYTSNPMTWNIMKEYREYVQYYCLSNMVYLSKLPDVGESRAFAQSLIHVLQAHKLVGDIFKELEGFDANASNDVLSPIFNRLVVGEKALVIERADFETQKEAYKTKYTLK